MTAGDGVAASEAVGMADATPESVEAEVGVDDPQPATIRTTATASTN
jgi:hypothetical protein